MKKRYTLVGFLLFLMLLMQILPFSVIPHTYASGENWFEGWNYRKSHEIYGSTEGAQTDYQVKIKVFYGGGLFFDEVWDSGTIATGIAADTARNILIEGDYLYAVSNSAQKLVIYDITDPETPIQESLTSLGYKALDIVKKNQYLLISVKGGLLVYDATDVTDPTYVTIKAMGDTYWIHGMVLVGNYLYCCMHQNDKFVILDVTDPTDPIEKDSLTGTTYFNGVHDVYVDGNYAFVTNYLAGVGEYGLTVVNVYDINDISVEIGVGENIQHSYITKVGDYLYCGTHDPDTGMTVWDVTTPTAPSYEGTFFESEGVSFGYRIAEYDENTIGAVSTGSDKLYLIDISTPDVPSISTSVSLGKTPKDLFIDDVYFYTSLEDGSYNWNIRSYLLSAGEDDGENVFLGGKCKTDFGDIRFTDDGGETELDYWMEEKVDSDYAVFWIEVDTIPVNPSSETIYVYYGMADATTSSDGETTFPWLFDDLDDYEIGNPPDATDWETEGINGGDTIDVQADPADASKKCFRIVESGDATNTILRALFKDKRVGLAINYRVRGNTDDTWYIQTWEGATQIVTIARRWDVDRWKWYTGSAYDDFVPTLASPLNTWQTMEDRTDSSGPYMHRIMDDVDAAGGFRNAPVVGMENTEFSMIATNPQILYIGGVGEDSRFIFVRKFIDPEPAHGAWGSEEVGDIPEFDVVDNNTSDIDSSADKGSHSDFSNEQDCANSEYDTLTEAGGAENDVFTDGFEDQTFNKWDQNGATSWQIGTFGSGTGGSADPHSGSYDAWSDQTHSGDLISDDIDLSGATGASLSIWISKDDIEGGDFLLSYWDGSQYDPIVDFDTLGSDDVWIEYSVQITSEYWISGFRLRINSGADKNENVYIDDVTVSKTTPNYQLDLEIQWTNANYTRTNEELCIKTGTVDAEDIKVDVWGGSEWINLLSDLNADSWNNVSVTTYLTGSTFTVRFKGGTETGDENQGTWQIDCVGLHTWEENGENNPPTNDACESDTFFDVDTYGWVRQTVTDVDGVADLKTVEILITTTDSRTFTLRWTQSSNIFSEVSDPDGICILDAGGSQRVNIDSDTDRIEFKFKISAVALKGYCSVQATVIDDTEAQDQDIYPDEFSINFYVELSLTDGSHSWSGLSPGDNDVLITSPGDGDIDLTITTNADFNLQAKGDGALSTNGYTIPLVNVEIHKDTLGSALGLTTGYANIGGLTAQTRGVGVPKSFKLWINVPTPLESGDYSYSCYVQGVES